MINKLTPHFIKHIFVTDIMLILAISAYNFLTIILPLARLRSGQILIFLIVIDIILVAIKLVNNYDFHS